MDSPVDSSVRRQVQHLLYEAGTLEDFQRWFAPVAWSLGEEDEDTSPIARTVERLLAEYTNGHWTRKELLTELLHLVRAPQVAQAKVRVRYVTRPATLAGEFDILGEPVGENEYEGATWQSEPVAS